MKVLLGFRDSSNCNSMDGIHHRNDKTVRCMEVCGLYYIRCNGFCAVLQAGASYSDIIINQAVHAKNIYLGVGRAYPLQCDRGQHVRPKEVNDMEERSYKMWTILLY